VFFVARKSALGKAQMLDSYEQEYHGLEDNHWWFRARRDLVARLVANVPKSARILELGCSGGVLIRGLKAKGFLDITGIDISGNAIKRCGERGVRAMVGDAAETKISGKKFDLIIASDLLEHIKDDSKALKEWHRLLNKGGKLIVFVPAFKFLWSGHDESNRHYRRYAKKGLLSLLRKAGFEIEKSGYWNFFLFFPTACIKLAHGKKSAGKNGKKTGQLREAGRLSNAFFFGLLKFENVSLCAGIPFPFGVSVFAIAKKGPVKK
jgi:SAM-dependent methyltransferase